MEQHGIVRTTLINWYVMSLYLLGYRDFARIKSIYRSAAFRSR